MVAQKISDKHFIEVFTTSTSLKEASEIMGLEMRTMTKRRRLLEEKYKIKISVIITDKNKNNVKPYLQTAHKHQPKINLGILNGTVIVFSDAHFYPNIHTAAYRGLLIAISELKPMAVIANGDIFDGSGISRHPRIGWAKSPTVKEELQACADAMTAIQEAAQKARHNVKLVWPLGNHDARFETFLAANASQYEHVRGFSLQDHFPAWTPCWSVWLNESVIVKHRYKGGVHATHNNAVSSGKSIVTGHLHSLKVTPLTDYNGVRYGVDCGTLAEIDGPQFSDYLEENPVNWRTGFVVLTFVDGQMLMPELVMKFNDNAIEFRGQVIPV